MSMSKLSVLEETNENFKVNQKQKFGSPDYAWCYFDLQSQNLSHFPSSLSLYIPYYYESGKQGILSLVFPIIFF